MRHFYLILVMIIMVLMAIACEQILPILDPEDRKPDPVVVTIDKLVYLPQDTIRITVHNNSEQSIFLEGCNPIYHNEMSDTGWVVKVMRVCVWEGFAIELLPNSVYEERHPASFFRGINRFMAPVYRDCLPDKPISEAKCTSTDKVYSSNFVVAIP